MRDRAQKMNRYREAIFSGKPVAPMGTTIEKDKEVLLAMEEKQKNDQIKIETLTAKRQALETGKVQPEELIGPFKE